ncbi:MAG: hypothetical protein F6K58_09105 [Symploca sp. SIO2E9]|nr:hypothetical protein [Symploca sp. SIO2E9]
MVAIFWVGLDSNSLWSDFHIFPREEREFLSMQLELKPILKIVEPTTRLTRA